MTDFCDMTTDELREAVASEIYEFIMGQGLTPNTEESRQKIVAHLSSFEAHFEVIAHPQTEAEKALRLSARMEVVPKTAWGYVELMRRQAEEIEARPSYTITKPAEPEGPYVISFDTKPHR